MLWPAAAATGTAALAAWVVGVTVPFAATLNDSLFAAGIVLLLVARLR